MGNTTVIISPELAENLQKLAEEAHLSLNELAEAVLSGYVAGRYDLPEDVPGDEEIAAVNATIAEAEQPGAVWYTQEEIEARLARKLASYNSPERSETGAA